MKKSINILILALVTTILSCKKGYLDINDNPNSATEATPELVLPNALATTASMLVTYHDYGAWAAGYHANAGGYGGWGSVFTYNYTTGDNNGMFTGTFTNLKDYQYVINSTAGIPKYVYFNSVARIMKAFNYQLLIDEYGDLPYTEGLKGADNVTPKYDSAASIYQALVGELDAAIAALKANISNTTVTKLGTADIYFNNTATNPQSDNTIDINSWIKFANNVKLRILIRAQNSSISSFVNTAFNTFTTEGFFTSDVMAQPGYSASANQNPMFGTYHSSTAGTYTGTGKSRIPSTFVYSFYNGGKLTDASRGALTYKNFGSTPNNQLGNEASAPVWITNFPAWYIGTGTGSSTGNAQGILKGRTAPMPIMLAAETYFLLAEAALNGHTLSGNAETNFESGMKASYNYLTKDYTNSTTQTETSLAAWLTAYKAANSGSYLVNWTLTDVAGTSSDYNPTTAGRKIEAIITQKYIALNYIAGWEAWNEMRRTGWPYSNPSGTAITSVVSLLSQSSRTDKLPVRNLLPQTELNLNPNAPAGLNVFTSKIFWDPN